MELNRVSPWLPSSLPWWPNHSTDRVSSTSSQNLRQIPASSPDIYEDLKALRRLWEKMLARWTTAADRGNIHATLVSLAKYTMEGTVE